MKKFKLIGCFVLVATTSFAQWNTSTNNINNTNSGNVGIGTGTPSTKLDVNGTFQVYPSGNAGTSGALKLQIVSGSSASVIQSNSDAVWNNHDIIIKAASSSGANADQLVVHRTGRIGIGAASPLSNLHVDGGTGGTSVMIGTTAAINRTSLWLNTQGETGKASIQSWWAGINQGSLSLNPSGGRVGIGTYNPEKDFHVDGGSAGTSMMLGSTTVTARTSLWLSTDGSNGKATIQSWHAGVNYGNLLLNPTGGNVGIGTTDPGSFKLAVNGKIWSQEVNVAMNNPGPDYVFEKEYHLLPLPELEIYITQNKHLPEVPSAKEMEADGLNLKDMNLILLKKVEELTLHLIEMKKANDDQQNMIKEINFNMTEQQNEIRRLNTTVANKK